MKAWIDQDLCTGDGLGEEIAPDKVASWPCRRGHHFLDVALA